MQKYFFLGLFSFLSLTNAFADEVSNECGRLHVQIGNATDIACRLTSSQIVHGNLLSSPPTMILAGSTGRFDINQTFYGPDIILEYRCGEHRIKFESQQNLCVLKAGRVSGKIIEAEPPSVMHASYASEVGSLYWGKPGLISWIIG